MLRRKSSQIRRCSASGETVMDNEDLLRLILLRLPVRSLLKFKLVSKRWFSMISSRNFSHHHGSISHPQLSPSGIFLCRRYPHPPVFDFVNLSTSPSMAPFESIDLLGGDSDDEVDSEIDFEIEILQSCNGLLLCRVGDSEYIESDYYIHNPTTKQFAPIPSYPDEDEVSANTPISGIHLVFDPSLSPNYEVVCVQSFDYTPTTRRNVTMVKYRIKIYSSETREWRLSNAVLEATTTMRFGVYWKRAFYWISHWNNCFCFDLVEDKIHKVQMPREKIKVEYFGNCCGHLYLIEFNDFEFDVWEMQDGHSGWSMKYHVVFQILCTAYPNLLPSEKNINDFSVLGMIDRSDRVDEVPYLVLRVHGELQSGEEVIRLNANDGSFERMMVIEEVEDIDPYMYIESLACV